MQCVQIDNLRIMLGVRKIDKINYGIKELGCVAKVVIEKVNEYTEVVWSSEKDGC